MILRRLVVAGGISAAIFGLLAVMVAIAAGGMKPLHEALPALLAGLAAAFAGGAVVFGWVPHLLGRFMASASDSFDFLNKASLGIALVAIGLGVVSALMMIFGIGAALTPLLVAVTLFVGASATMCSLKFFLGNRGA